MSQKPSKSPATQPVRKIANLVDVLSLQPGVSYSHQGKRFVSSGDGIRDVVTTIAATQGYDRGLTCLQGLVAMMGRHGGLTWSEAESAYRKACIEAGVTIPLHPR